MPNPKHRHSKARRDKRRAHDALDRPTTSTCSNCGEVKMPHRACAACGFYRNRQVIQGKAEI